MEQWKKSDKTAVEALDLGNQATYKVDPQHWPHGENAVREMHDIKFRKMSGCSTHNSNTAYSHTGLTKDLKATARPLGPRKSLTWHSAPILCGQRVDIFSIIELQVNLRSK